MKTRSNILFQAARFLLLPLAAAPVYGQLNPSELADVGFTSLQARLGAGTPTGAGISISQIEAPDGVGAYRPNVAAFPGHNFVFADPGGNAGVSSHATTVAAYFYGAGSFSPGVGTGAAQITSYDANSWIGSEFLHTNGSLPATETGLIQNHSWIGTGGSVAVDTQILNRLDYAIQTQHFLAVVGLNNGSANPVPSLLASAYNVITVGVSDGDHSGGTALIGTARTRPDIVVPTSLTSWATAAVSSAGALVMENTTTSGRRSEVVKAVLMAGATRSGEAEFTWSHTTIQPLDTTRGAGELNVDRSQQIISAGEQNSSPTVDVTNVGWDLGTKTGGTDNLYFFNVPANSEFSAVLTWNQIITATDTNPGAGENFTFAGALANLDLRLLTATGNTPGTLITESVSTIDNSELVTTTLPAGRYVLQVRSTGATTEYGLAWNTVVPEPSSVLLLSVASGFLVRRRRR